MVFGRANTPPLDLRSGKVQSRCDSGSLLTVCRVRRCATATRLFWMGCNRSLGVPIVEQYGTSEAAVVATNAPPPGLSKPGTCGVPCAGYRQDRYRRWTPISAGRAGGDSDGGPSLISGYLNAPELNRACFVGGWFRTGDIGSIDEDGFLTLHGRKNDLINRGGEKISPLEIDEALARHPAVAEAAAFAGNASAPRGRHCRSRRITSRFGGHSGRASPLSAGPGRFVQSSTKDRDQ